MSGGIYTAEGEAVGSLDPDNGKIITKKELEQTRDREMLVLKEPLDLEQYVDFKVLLPEYLPEGYVFDRGEVSRVKSKINSKYLGLFYNNEVTGDVIYITERMPEASINYSDAPGTLNELQINGQKAVLIGEWLLAWEANDISYTVYGKGLDNNEKIRIAESMR